MVAAVYDTVCDIQCVHCGRFYVLSFNREDMADWLSGSLPIQDALSYLTAGERELLISGTCDDCFNVLFPDLDNDE